MSGYNGRRAPNFSQYLEELNTAPFYDQPQQQNQTQSRNQQDNLFDVDAELAMFTNAEFLDFDALQTDLPADLGQDQSAQPDGSSSGVKFVEMLNDFKLPDYNPFYSAQMLPLQASNYPARHSQNTNGHQGPVGAPGLIQPAPASTHHQGPASAAAQHSPVAQSAQQAAASSRSPTNSNASSKRKPDQSALDEAARLAQEEDKRRRNTAASARFRIKKKEREKNLERTVKEVTAKNATLETRISQLELENRWLKNLITEKNGSPISDGDLSGMLSKLRETKTEGERAS